MEAFLDPSVVSLSIVFIFGAWKSSTIGRKPRGAQPLAETPYPAGFIGPAPYKIEDVGLNLLERARVECVAGDLLRDLGYLSAKSSISFSAKAAVLLSDVAERIVSFYRHL